MRAAMLALGLIITAGPVRADEEKIDIKSLPKAVLAAASLPVAIARPAATSVRMAPLCG